MSRQRFEVLHDDGEVEFVASTGEAAQALEAVMGLKVSKAHLDLLAFITGFGELGRAHQRSGAIAGFLIDVACDLA